MRPRSIGRRLAFQYLFMADLQRFADLESPHDFFRVQREAVQDNSGAQADKDGDFVFDDPDPRRDEAEMFAFSLVKAALENREAIDEKISGAALNWTLARMGAVERNALRLAAAELLLGETPPNVIIDEVVELAKRFGDKDSGAFVNGIADRIVKQG